MEVAQQSNSSCIVRNWDKEVDALKEAISMPARTPWQKTAEFVDGLKGKLPDWELAEIKRYVEKRCRKEAQAQAQMTAKPVGTVT